ncbi:MAG: toll/interleukin-1 receptor domain-containing protein, partial [Deltaproteobacteria bacterium]|nr:toll/interleukin-1 receptor domain-containing protein [Deltaproteobacteria bacterium]
MAIDQKPSSTVPSQSTGTGASYGEPLLLFVCCPGRDRGLARRFKERLRAMGHRTWHDVERIDIGGAFDDVLDEALRSCDAVIGLLGEVGGQATWVRNAWAAAALHGKMLFLATIDECVPPAFFDRKTHIQYDPDNEEKCFESLEDGLARLAEARADRKKKTTMTTSTLVPTTASGSTDHEQGAASLRAVMSWDVAMQGTVLTFEDGDERIWATNGSEVRIYEFDKPTPVDRRFLEKRPWKQVFRTTWNGRMLASDWDGGLYTLGPDTDPGGEPLRAGMYSSLPVHLVATGRHTLFATTWDGHVLAWDGHGLDGTSIGRLPHLPRRLLALADGGAIVVDEGGNVLGFGPRGMKRFEIRLKPPVATLWTCDVFRRKGVAAITGDQGIVLMDLEGAVVRDSAIGADPLVLAHRNDSQYDCFTALATDTRELKWLDWTSFCIIDQITVSLPFSVRRMGCFSEPGRSTLLQVIGLSDDGALFSTCEHSLVRYESEPFEDCSLFAGGHLLLCRSGTKMHLYRNPVLSDAACSVAVKGLTGSLQVGTFGELVVVLENDGKIPIRRLDAVLDGENRIEPSSAHHDERVMPGDRVSLTFFVRGHATGARVPLQLD